MKQNKLRKFVDKAIFCDHDNLDYTDDELSFYDRESLAAKLNFMAIYCKDCGLLMALNHDNLGVLDD